MEAERSLWMRFEGWIDTVSKITGYVGAFCVLAAALIVTEGVIVRKVFGWSTTWQIEMSIFLLIYACFVGAAHAQIEEKHLNVDLLIIHLPPRAREILLIVVAVLSMTMCAIMAYYAWPMWWESLILKEHSESLWGPPLWIPYLFLPLGMTLLTLQYVATIGRKIRALREGTYEQEAIRTELREIEIPPVAGRDGGVGDHG